ncbi:MAG: hypothetical protein KF845_13105 [Cyclobacteriaceae bacterium]|nr:hypothetical protein [Cyclobacteriaceae bacterium]
MNYLSVAQYFYKLYARLFVLVLIPAGVFIFLYQALQAVWLPLPELDIEPEIVVYAAGFIAGAVWLTAFLIMHIRLKRIRKIVSLGERLSRYAKLTTVRSVLFSAGMLVLALGYYLTQQQWLTVAFMISLLLPAIFWPAPARVCYDLRLKGDERMMILYKMG